MNAELALIKQGIALGEMTRALGLVPSIAFHHVTKEVRDELEAEGFTLLNHEVCEDSRPSRWSEVGDVTLFWQENHE